MAVLAPDGACFTGGTHAGNPFAVAMGLRTLDWLEAHPEAYTEMDRRAKQLARGIEDALRGLDLDYAVLQYESIVDFKFRPGPPTENYDDAKRADRTKFAAFYHAMRERGILLAPSQNEVMFLSVAHSDDDVAETIGAAAAALAEMRANGVL
jgi:glutamate-1-semialdehyde 2,1-aminomutase